MLYWRKTLATIAVIGLLLLLGSGCGQDFAPEPEPSEPADEPEPEAQPSATYESIAASIAGIDTSAPTALASLIGVSQELATAESEGTVSDEEGEQLGEDLSTGFSDFVRSEVDAIDPTDLGALNDFFKLQRIQKLDEYGKHCDEQTSQYKEDQMEEKFNEYIRNWVDQIDPDDPEALKDIFFLQKIQMCGSKYQMATTETDNYKHQQMGSKFNQWVRNTVDNIDPSDPDAIGEMVFLQKLQNRKTWEEYATADTAQYKHEQLEDKFNDWVRERVDELDPTDPDFEEEMEKLRVLQKLEKYRELVRPETHDYKENQLAVAMADYATNLVDNIVPGLLHDLDKLVDLTFTDIYQEFCPAQTKEYVGEQLEEKYITEPGEPPKMVGVWPENGQAGVDPGERVIMVFDQPMEPASVAENLVIYPHADAGVSWLDGNFIFMLESSENFDTGTAYTIFLEPGAESEAGLFLEPGYEFSFSTRGAREEPRVIQDLPLEGQIDVAVGDPMLVIFDQPMDTGSTEAAITIKPALDYLVYWRNEGAVMFIIPVSSMEFNTTYSLEIGSGARSMDGLPLDNPFNLQFITGLVPPPGVTGTLPFDGQENVPAGYPILITFSWPMDPDSVASALSISPGIDYDLEWSDANFVMEIVPGPEFDLDILQGGQIVNDGGATEYTITIGRDAKSIDGLPLVESFSLSLTTGKDIQESIVQLR